jgi:hypothetical protein
MLWHTCENGENEMCDYMPPGNAEPQLGSKTKTEESKAKEAKLGLGVPGLYSPKGWYSRGYLPHCDSLQKLQSITFRLADSLPQSKLRQLELEIEFSPESVREAERRKQIEKWLDAGILGSLYPR